VGQVVPIPLLIPLLALKSALVGRFVYRGRLRARADRLFGCSVIKGSGAIGQILMRVGTRDLVVYYESGPKADFAVSQARMKWMGGEPVEDKDFKIIQTTLSEWAKARGSTVAWI
jgi:hypothetical protein